MIGAVNSNCREVWLVLHGYGQLSQFFIRSFSSLVAEHRLIVAPEGLHRFYIEGFAGRVGASWMTKEERDSDIVDYLEYLDLVLKELRNQGVPQNAKINLLGFSQGASTACRWFFHTKEEVQAIVLWSGMVPPDLNLAIGDRQKWENAYLVFDSNDPFHHTEHFQRQLSWLEENKLPFQLVESSSGHAITAEGISNLLREME